MAALDRRRMHFVQGRVLTKAEQEELVKQTTHNVRYNKKPNLSLILASVALGLTAPPSLPRKKK